MAVCKPLSVMAVCKPLPPNHLIPIETPFPLLISNWDVGWCCIHLIALGKGPCYIRGREGVPQHHSGVAGSTYCAAAH